MNRKFYSRLLIVLALWLSFSFVDYGMILGAFTYSFPYEKNFAISISIAISGPLALPAVMSASYPNSSCWHWRLVPFNTERRWEAFHQLLPQETKQDFHNWTD